MDEYKGCLCELCNKEFGEDDDIVVCPDCGTPMHRACWNERRACPNEALHANGFSWATEKKPKPTATVTADAAQDDSNPEDMTINEMIEKIILQREKSEGEAPIECEGVTQKELLYFFGRSNIFTPRYISYCAQLAVTGRKTSLNLFAALFSSAYYFYRRVNLPAFVLTLVLSVLSLPQLLMYIATYVPDLQDAVEKIGRSDLYSTLSSGFLLLQGCILVAIMIFGDFFYVRWSLRRIKSIRLRFGTDRGEEYLLALEAAGTPRFSGFFLGIVLNTCVNSGLVWLLYTVITSSTTA